MLLHLGMSPLLGFHLLDIPGCSIPNGHLFGAQRQDIGVS
jgi:hypothetical protein